MEQPSKIKQMKRDAARGNPDRKSDHINLAIQSRTPVGELDERFWYEPMISGFPKGHSVPISFAGKKLRVPLWVSSMTGGHPLSGIINRNLATACHEFGMGMGLGSCRKLLQDNAGIEDFDLRPIMGEEVPLFANLGIAQIEELVTENKTDSVRRLVDRLKADGLVIHVNPLQEWIQPEGNTIVHPPAETIARFLERIDFPVIVKEVGQGFGPQSIRRLLQLPLVAIEFGAFGGTNFSKIETSRTPTFKNPWYEPFVNVGVGAGEMVDLINGMVKAGERFSCNQLIISGGIRNYLDGYYLIRKSMVPAIYAQASEFLSHSRGDYSELQQFTAAQVEGYNIANSFLTLKEKNSTP